MDEKNGCTISFKFKIGDRILDRFNSPGLILVCSYEYHNFYLVEFLLGNRRIIAEEGLTLDKNPKQGA